MKTRTGRLELRVLEALADGNAKFFCRARWAVAYAHGAVGEGGYRSGISESFRASFTRTITSMIEKKWISLEDFDMRSATVWDICEISVFITLNETEMKARLAEFTEAEKQPKKLRERNAILLFGVHRAWVVDSKQYSKLKISKHGIDVLKRNESGVARKP